MEIYESGFDTDDAETLRSKCIFSKDRIIIRHRIYEID